MESLYFPIPSEKYLLPPSKKQSVHGFKIKAETRQQVFALVQEEVHTTPGKGCEYVIEPDE